MKKRLLAMLLVLMLVVGLLPVGASAADGDTVNRIRLMNKEAWGLAAIEKAGYSNEDVLWSNITSIRFFASDGSYTNWGVARNEVPDCYSHEGYLATDAGTKIVPSSVDRIVVELKFAYNGLEAGKIISATAVFHDEEFTLDYSEGSAGVREYAEFTLKSGQSYDKDYSVTFYFQPIGTADWELYDIVYVDAGTSIGSDMPANPNYGSQDFVSWQTQTDGGGDTLKSTTVIHKDWVVYGTKTTAGGATAYHVMRDSGSNRYNALQEEIADAYNAENNTSYTSGNVQITAIQVNGIDSEHTNPDYFNNGWRESNRYYYIYNVNAYGLDNHQNTRIPVSEVTGITLTGTIDGNSFSVMIPRDELALQEISNPGTSDTIIEISVCDKLDGITKELVESAEDAPADVTGVSYPVDGKVTIPEDGSVTLLYKITVTGDQNAEYIVTDENATAVSGSLTGTLDTDGVAVIYVTKTFSADDVVNGVLTNSASLSNDSTTLPPDDGNDEDEVEVEVEDEGGEEPEPEEPRDPAEAELRKLAVVLECTNGEVEHDEKTKAFHLRTTNSKCEIQQVGEEYICSVTPDYDKILSTYNTATKATHVYEDEGKQFVLTWNASTNAWENAGDVASITRQVKCDTPEPETQRVNVYAVKDRNYDTRVLIGSFMAPVGTNVIDFVEEQPLNEPEGFDKYEPANDGYYKDGLEYTFGENDTVSGWTNVYVNYIGKEQTVQVVIYRNGDTTTPYKTESIGPMRTGETLNIADLDINDYYQTQSGSIRFDFEGWYNDGGWNSYKDGNPDNTLGSSITINGYTNIICMVWDVERVNVQAVVDGKKDAAETIFTGEARRGTNLIDYLNAHTSEMTDYDRVGYIRDQWYNRDWYGHKFAADTTVNGWTNVYVTYTSDWQPVHVVIYKNGDTSKPVVDVAIYSLRKGETLDTTELDISEYYTPDKFATGFDYEGWFNDGAWNDYKDAGCPEDATGLDEIYINGWTNVIAMVWDQFPVNYHVLDESGAEVDSNNEVRTARDLNDDFWWPEVDAGYAFDGWYEKAEDIGNESKKEGLPLALKKYELYGELVSLAPEEGPDEDDLAKLKVLVKDNSGAINHGNETFGLVDDCYTTSGITETEGVYTYTITPTVAEYVKLYDRTKNFVEGSHTATTSQSKVHSFVFTWTDGEWVADKNSVTIGVKCSVTVPTADELAELLQIRVKDYAGAEELPVGVTDHGQFVTGILEGTYSIAGPTAENNTFVATVTLTDGSAYAAAYDENKQLDAGTHALTTTISKLDPITLTYDFTTGTWSASNTGWSLGVKCEQDSTPVTPVIPMPTPGEISDLIKDKVVVDCVNDEMNHGDKAYGLLDDALVRIEKTDDTTVKVTLNATVYQARYNTDTETKHSLADGQSSTVTFALSYIDEVWQAVTNDLPITIEVICDTVPVEPDPGVTGFTKTLVTDRDLYNARGIAYPDFYRGTVIVDEGDRVTLIYNITVKGTAGTEFTVCDDSADFAQIGVIPPSGETSFYVTKTFSWRDVRNAGDTLDNTASVSVDGETVKTDTERVPVDIDWDINVPDIDDDDDDDDTVYVPNWLNTTDHYAYIVGYEDGTIRPQNNITRAEVSTIFFRLLTDNARARYWSTTNDFSDIAPESWYNNAVSTLSNMGIINGYEDGTFKPNASITRAEFTAIATRFFDYEAEYDGAFNDVSARAWYADYVQAAVDMGLVDGYPDGGFHPNSNITRAEAVTIVNRVLNRAPHEDHLLDEDEMNVWPDNVYGAWYYADMQEATNSHDYDWIRVSGERVEEWTEKLPERDWAALEQEWSSSHDA